MYADTLLPTLITDLQLAHRIGIAAPTLRRWARRGLIPGRILPDGSVLFDPVDVLEWLRSLDTKSGACSPQEAARE